MLTRKPLYLLLAVFVILSAIRSIASVELISAQQYDSIRLIIGILAVAMLPVAIMVTYAAIDVRATLIEGNRDKWHGLSSVVIWRLGIWAATCCALSLEGLIFYAV